MLCFSGLWNILREMLDHLFAITVYVAGLSIAEYIARMGQHLKLYCLEKKVKVIKPILIFTC